MDGPIHIALTIAPDGKVAKAKADGPEAIVNSCVERAIAGAKFAKTQKGGTTTATFQFHAPPPPTSPY